MSKTCSKCKISKELSEFSSSKQSKDGLRPECRSCRSQEAKQRRIRRGGTNRIDRIQETIELKICTRCMILQKRSDFNNNSWCKFCVNKQNRKYSDALGIKPKFVPIVTNTTKQCCRCKDIKLLDEYSNSKRGRLGKSAYCKKCFAIKMITEYSTKEERRQITQNYRDKNREWWRSLHRINQFNRRMNIYNLSDGTVDKDFVISVYNTGVCYYCKNEIDRDKRTLEHKHPLNKGGLHSKSNIVMACLSCNSSKSDMTEQEFKTYLDHDNRTDSGRQQEPPRQQDNDFCPNVSPDNSQ